MAAQRIRECTCNDCGHLFDAMNGFASRCPLCNSASIIEEMVKNDHEELVPGEKVEVVEFYCGSCKKIGESFNALPKKCPCCKKKNSLQRRSMEVD